jgi:hypothetical protein
MEIDVIEDYELFYGKINGGYVVSDGESSDGPGWSWKCHDT